MLSPNFKEGTTLREESVVVVPLPDDDPAAMTMILRAMHMQYPNKQQPDPTEHMLEVAGLCDKYCCADAIWPITNYMLEWSHESLWCRYHNLNSTTMDSEPRTGNLLIAAAVLKNAVVARNIGKTLLTRCVEKSPYPQTVKGQALISMLGTDIFRE